jgi:gluconate 2-dehydrogenase gamma chain
MAAEADLLTRRAALQRAAWLMGGAISAPTLAGVLAGCGRGADHGGGAARVLSAEQHEMVAVIAEHIIPETDTPGARTVGVPEFIDQMLATWYPEEERNWFLAGLADVDGWARQQHGARFLECSPEQQFALLVALDREAFASPPAAAARPVADQVPDVRARIDGGGTPLPPEAAVDTVRWITGEARQQRAAVPFFHMIKELTLVGYYTSEAGATQELRHEPVPGRYEGCVPFERIGRSWAV